MKKISIYNWIIRILLMLYIICYGISFTYLSTINPPRSLTYGDEWWRLWNTLFLYGWLLIHPTICFTICAMRGKILLGIKHTAASIGAVAIFYAVLCMNWQTDYLGAVILGSYIYGLLLFAWLLVILAKEKVLTTKKRSTPHISFPS